MSNDRAVVGKRLKLARVQRGLTQDDLVRNAGISRKTLYNIEHGDESVTRDSLLAVCNALGVNEDGYQDTSGQPRPDDAETLMRTLTRMPSEVRVAMVVYGKWLTGLSPAERSAEIDRMLIRTME